MNNDLDIWWSAFLAALAGGKILDAESTADYALVTYKRKAAELETDDGQ